MQGRIFAANLVRPGYQFSQARRIVQIPVADLILLRIEVLFAALTHREVFAQFEGGAVNSIVGTQSGGQQQANHEGGAAALLQKFSEDVWSIGPQIGTEILCLLYTSP